MRRFGVEPCRSNLDSYGLVLAEVPDNFEENAGVEDPVRLVGRF